MTMYKIVIPAALVLAVGAIAIGTLAVRSNKPNPLREVASHQPEHTQQTPVPAMPRPVRPEPQSDIPLAEPSQTPQTAPDDEPRRGFRGLRRPSLGDSPMNPEDWAERWSSRQGRRQDWINRFDTDDDGVISEEERDAMREFMRERRNEFMLRRMTNRFDADGDGQLTGDERIEAEAEMEVRRAEREARMVERFDADGDGQLSDTERQSVRESFGGRGRGPGGDPQARQDTIQRYDADGDGQLNLDESYDAYLDRFDARQQRLFTQRYDDNNDGAVDTGDLDAFLTRYRAEDPQADINGDGTLNQLDVERFRDLMIVAP